MRSSTGVYAVALALVVQALPRSVPAQQSRPIVAIFAHPDDERVIGPLLSRLAREGRETHLVIATDGSQGVTDFAKIPAGAPVTTVGRRPNCDIWPSGGNICSASFATSCSACR